MVTFRSNNTNNNRRPSFRSNNNRRPHLHYEVIENGKKINSQTLKLPSGKILKSKNRELFEVTRIKLDVLKSELIIGLN
jgi:hypothetical protein